MLETDPETLVWPWVIAADRVPSSNACLGSKRRKRPTMAMPLRVKSSVTLRVAATGQKRFAWRTQNWKRETGKPTTTPHRGILAKLLAASAQHRAGSLQLRSHNLQ